MGSMKPRAKNLILDLLLAMDGAPISAQDAIRACSLFGLTANNVRVSLARLAAENLIEGAGRASYRLGPAALQLAGEVATWRAAEQRMRPWNGDFVAVFTGDLGRSDRAALRRRKRALDMLGFAEFRRGLYLRPDNIEKDLSGVRQRLRNLGLEARASVFLANGWDEATQNTLAELWNTEQLNAHYRHLRGQLLDWLERCGELDPVEAARESFLLGGRAIRQVVFDPLLPAPFIDVAARHAFLAAVKRYDAAGRAIWQRVLDPSAVVSTPVLNPA